MKMRVHLLRLMARLRLCSALAQYWAQLPTYTQSVRGGRQSEEPDRKDCTTQCYSGNPLKLYGVAAALRCLLPVPPPPPPPYLSLSLSFYFFLASTVSIHGRSRRLDYVVIGFAAIGTVHAHPTNFLVISREPPTVR